MQTLMSAAGLCSAIALGGMATSTLAAPPSTPSKSLEFTRLDQSDRQTLLRFETRHYLVRVYRQKGETFLNVYNKETGFTDQNGVLAQVELAETETGTWYTYVNQNGDLHYFARVNPSGQTELEIRVAGGSPDIPEVGFNATYGFPHQYLGQDIDSALAELEATQWTVEEWIVEDPRANQIELARDELTLMLKFDPTTRLITYTLAD